jgi:ATP-binding cassette subfamily F protein uup
VVVVSHDRWFLDRTVDRLFVLGDGTARRFEGNYSAYREALKAVVAAPEPSSPGWLAAKTAANPSPATGTEDSQRAPSPLQRRSYKENRELEALERELPLWERQRQSLEERLSQAGAVGFSQLEELSQELATLVARIHAAEERWLHLSERPE